MKKTDSDQKDIDRAVVTDINVDITTLNFCQAKIAGVLILFYYGKK